MEQPTDRDTRIRRFIASTPDAPIVHDVAAAMAELDTLQRTTEAHQVKALTERMRRAEQRAESEHAVATAAVAAQRLAETRAQDAGQLVATVAAERDALAQALLRYAVHPFACDSWRLMSGTNVPCPCSCGLADALGQALVALAGVMKGGVTDAGE